jgi:phosphoribulokinase
MNERLTGPAEEAAMEAAMASPPGDVAAEAPRAAEAEDGNGLSPVFLLGIVGDSGSGKNTVADAVVGLLGAPRVTDLRLDDYHRYTREERGELGFTPLHPEVHDLTLMEEHLRLLREGRPIRNRTYRHENGTFGPVRIIDPREIVLARGLLGFPNPELHALYDLAVFLQPEPELLFRWKLRRDVLFRGYREAEVLKSIATHLLDAKEFVLPQGERADLLVHYGLPDPDAPDSEVVTTLRFRNGAAEILPELELPDGDSLDGAADATERAIRVPADIPERVVDDWGRRLFGDRYDAAATGVYHDGDGEPRRRASLAFVELLIAGIAATMVRHH